jgi:phosphoribosylformylglycinamidine (FGAM) synthase-like enzyme
VTHHGELVAEIPNKALTDDAPVYKRPVGVWKAPVPMDPPAWVVEELKKPRDYTADLKRLLGSANICDKRWVFEQYDSMVQTNTVQGPGGEAGVMRIKDSCRLPVAGCRLENKDGRPATDNLQPATRPQRGLAMALAGNGRWCWLDPKLGAMHAVAEAARKVACTGAVPVAATNCLNFGNPEKPEIMAQLSAAIDGIAEACTALDVPVTGGNVSLYNETKGEGIYPTPVIGVVGLLEDVGKAVPSGFQRVGESVVLLWPDFPEVEGEQDEEESLHATLQMLGSQALTSHLALGNWGRPPFLSLRSAANMQKLLAKLADQGLITSAQDISDGGIAVALARACFTHDIGADIDMAAWTDDIVPVKLFWEYGNHIVVTCKSDDFGLIEKFAKEYKYIAEEIGTTGSSGLSIKLRGAAQIAVSIADLRSSYEGTLESQLGAEVVTA